MRRQVDAGWLQPVPDRSVMGRCQSNSVPPMTETPDEASA